MVLRVCDAAPQSVRDGNSASRGGLEKSAAIAVDLAHPSLLVLIGRAGLT